MRWKDVNVTRLAKEQGRSSQFGHVPLEMDFGGELDEANTLDAELFKFSQELFAADG